MFRTSLKTGVAYDNRGYHSAEAPHAFGLLRAWGERPRRRAADQRDELATLQLSKLHPLPQARSEHNRLLSSKGSPQCGISIRPMSGWGQNTNCRPAALCQLSPAADFWLPISQ